MHVPRPWCQWVSGCARAAPQSPEKDERVVTKDSEPCRLPSRREPEARSLTHKASPSGQGCRRCIRDGAGRNSSCNRRRRCQIRYRIAAATWPAGARHIYRARLVCPLGTIRQTRAAPIPWQFIRKRIECRGLSYLPLSRPLCLDLPV
jgi:hypothetical protein